MDNLQLSPIAYDDEARFNAQALFLYALLKERDPVANISHNHNNVPPFFRHVQFMDSRPYAAWYVVEMGGEMIGSAYLTKAGPGFLGDEIGLFLAKPYQGKAYGRRVLHMLMDAHQRQRYYANIAPANIRSQEFFVTRGFRELQRVYVWERE